MRGILEQGDTWGAVCFHFKSVQILTYYCIFSASPTIDPDSRGVHALKLTLTCERKRRGSVGVGVEGKEEVRQTSRRIIGTDTMRFLFFFCVNISLCVSFLHFHISSTSSPPPLVQTGKVIPRTPSARCPRHTILSGPRL